MATKKIAAPKGERKYARRGFLKTVGAALVVAAAPAIATTSATYPRAELLDYEVQLIQEYYEEMREKGLKGREAARFLAAKFDSAAL